MLKSISSFATGRRSKYVVVAFWLLLAFALSPLVGKLADVTVDENRAYLPSSAESTEVDRLIEDDFASGREVDAVIAFENEDGLDAADRKAIAAEAQQICDSDQIADLLAVIDPFQGPVCGEAAGGGEAAGAGGEGAAAREQGPQAVSEDGTAALMLVRTNTDDSEDIRDNVDALREIVPAADAEGLHAYVSGIAGVVADSTEVFESIDGTLLLVTVTLVLVLLLLIYRSPVIAFVPLFVVAIAYMIAAAATYGLVESGVFDVNSQTTSLLIVLMFGAGTDYALLIVSRFREELRHIEDKHEAMARATERTAPAILSAGGTVVAAMMVLTLADMRSTQTMGPVLALGVLIMLAAGLTLLPAILAILGRRSFWPSIPRLGSEQRRPVGVWRRVGQFVHEHSVFVMVAVIAVLLLGSLGNLKDRGSIDFGEGFREKPDSVLGQEVIEEKLDGGATGLTNVIVDSDPATVESVSSALAGLEGVASVVPTEASDDGSLQQIDVTLAYDPYSDEASELVTPMRETAKEAADGATALVGGVSAQNFDTQETVRDDAKLIVPLILLLIFVILSILLRAVVAPLYLVGTVVLSYAFAVGATALIFTELFNQPDTDPGLATFAFIFLVAPGVDYNIFLISRIREEAAFQETKEAVISGLEKTGGVITSAGLILAGTFGALMALPLETLFQIGFTVAFGLLVDTFVIRTLLVPAIAFRLGERNWWPSKISHDAERVD
jgi:RND superfamily putative drug exporter